MKTNESKIFPVITDETEEFAILFSGDSATMS